MPKISNEIVGQIDHSKCKHPKTSHEYRKCRDRKVAAATKRAETATGIEPLADALLRREAEASVALDGETFAVEGEPDDEDVVDEEEEHSGVLSLTSIGTLHATIISLSDSLAEYGDVLEASIRLDTDKFGEVEVVYGIETEGWGVRL